MVHGFRYFGGVTECVLADRRKTVSSGGGATCEGNRVAARLTRPGHAIKMGCQYSFFSAPLRLRVEEIPQHVSKPGAPGAFIMTGAVDFRIPQICAFPPALFD